MEIIRAISVAVRDAAWGTVLPSVLVQDVERRRTSFTIRLGVEHVRDEVDFAWEGSIVGDADGTIRFAFRGRVRRAFLRARIGFCVVHPRAFAGQPVGIATPWGSFEGRFPTRIAPVSMFSMIRSIRQPLANGSTLAIDFEGDLFETEDQRNFGDASFKTYCTPLCLPQPVLVEEGETIEQAVTVSVRPRLSVPRRRVAQRSVEVGREAVASLPQVGLTAIGEGVTPPDGAAARLRMLAIDHLRVEVDADSPSAAQRLAEGRRQARAAGARVELSLLSDAVGTGIAETLGRACDMAIDPVRVLLHDRTSAGTTRAALESLRASMQRRALTAPVGGGSRAWFDLVNMRPPIPGPDLLTFGMSPQAHAFDDATIMENVETLSDIIDSAVVIADGRRLSVGPIGIAYPFDPWAPETGRKTTSGLPYGLDRRQPTMLAAAWTLGALARLARVEVASITLREWAGMAGVIAAEQDGAPPPVVAPGEAQPLFHVLAALRGLHGQPAVLASAAPGGVACLALRDETLVRVLLANLAPDERSLSLRMPGTGAATCRILDRPSLASWRWDATGWSTPADGIHPSKGRIPLVLPGYAVATLERRA
jgi:hypothetical protein